MEFKMFVQIFLVIILLTNSIECAVEKVKPSENKDYPGKCWEPHRKIAYPVGEHFIKGECVRLHCKKDLSYEMES